MAKDQKSDTSKAILQVTAFSQNAPSVLHPRHPFGVSGSSPANSFQ
jgi:hypothetical protein